MSVRRLLCAVFHQKVTAKHATDGRTNANSNLRCYLLAVDGDALHHFTSSSSSSSDKLPTAAATAPAADFLRRNLDRRTHGIFISSQLFASHVLRGRRDIYMGWSSVSVIGGITISVLCGNTPYCVKLSGEFSSRYSNKMESVDLRKWPYYHYLRKWRHNSKHFAELAPHQGRKSWHRYGMKKRHYQLLNTFQIKVFVGLYLKDFLKVFVLSHGLKLNLHT